MFSYYVRVTALQRRSANHLLNTRTVYSLTVFLPYYYNTVRSTCAPALWVLRLRSMHRRAVRRLRRSIFPEQAVTRGESMPGLLCVVTTLTVWGGVHRVHSTCPLTRRGAGLDWGGELRPNA